MLCRTYNWDQSSLLDIAEDKSWKMRYDLHDATIEVGSTIYHMVIDVYMKGAEVWIWVAPTSLRLMQGERIVDEKEVIDIFLMVFNDDFGGNVEIDNKP